MKLFTRIVIINLLMLSTFGAINAQENLQSGSPYLGWNSYDCYGTHINEELTYDNLDAFISKLQPHGYEYFVLDAGWYRHYDLKPGEAWPTDGDKKYLALDEFSRYIPSSVLFPNGLKAIMDHAHEHDVKFGLHLMRGISREAVQKNLKIKGTKYRAQDIADTTDICNWSTLNYGVDMDKPGAQEYYNSVVELVASWGVDFLKYDDIVHKPKEILAVIEAIKKSGREITLSISPGNDINPEYYDIYKQADMIRISRDIWDLKEDIDITFDRWEQILPYADKGFWLDMDMIPFGHIRVNYPFSANKMDSGRGYERMDYFTYEQKKTFITQRAMAASPLFMGGALTTSPQTVFELITDEGMLACNQNGVTGKLLERVKDYAEFVDVWQTAHRTQENEGWIGVFNRNEYQEIIEFDKEELGLDASLEYKLFDIWDKRNIEDQDSFIFELMPDDVIFIHYKAK